MQDVYPVVTVATGEESYLELCYSVHAAKFAYQQEGVSRQAQLLLPREGKHLCARIYAATGATRTVVQSNDALLTTDEVQKH